MNRSRRGTLQQLEPRLLMSADLAPLPPDLPLSSSEGEAATLLIATLDGQESHAPTPQEVAAEAASRRELIVVDPGTARFQEIVDGILESSDGKNTYEVVVLDPHSDGLEQITELLGVDGGLDALHLVSDGPLLRLGSSQLDTDQIDAARHTLALWREAFNTDAQLFLQNAAQITSPQREAMATTVAEHTGLQLSVSRSLPVATDDLDHAASTPGADDDSAVRTELVFVDGGIEDHEALIAGFLDAGTQQRLIEVVVLDPARDGIRQITDALSRHEGLDAVHVLSHGDQASLTLGSATLDARSLETYRTDIAGWADALDAEADLLLYGCDLAAGEDGRALIAALADLTGADIAASDDLTGNSELGGDWELEYRSGSIDSQITVSSALQQAWSEVLATFTVSSDADSGAGSLRQAILDANSAGEASNIEFDIAGAGVKTIALLSELPTITNQLTLDGTTQTGFAATPLIELDGAAAGAGANGLTLGAGSDGSVIRGLSIHRFTNHGVLIDGADGNSIAGNHIGTDASGTLDLGNTVAGVFITNGASGNTIGGLTTAERNVIAGNNDDALNIEATAGTGNLVIGNYIGIDVSGETALGNNGSGIDVQANGNTIGGAVPQARNVISSNGYNGVVISGSGNTVEGNLIGTDINSSPVFGNGKSGIWIVGDSNLIGGTSAGAGNLIAGNTWDGIRVTGTGTGNAILGNSVYGNLQSGIDLGNDGVTANDAGDGDGGDNDLQNFPVLGTAITDGVDIIGITGSLNSTASTTFRIEFFSSPAGSGDGSGHGEGRTYLGFTAVTTDGSGNAVFDVTLAAGVSIGDLVTATATVDLGSGNYASTSEFAQNITSNAENPVTNDAPGNVVPGTQRIERDGRLVFASATGTGITISDFDAGSSAIEVTLTASNGTLTLPSTEGLLFNTGDGGDDPLMSFTGTLADINAALQGMTFAPNPGFTGTASVQVHTDDLGNTGSGGAKTDTDLVTINVVEPEQSLWLTFENDEGGTGNTDIPSVTGGDVVTFDSITALESSDTDPLASVTSGTFSARFNLDTVLLSDGITLASDGNTTVNAVHRVSRDTTVGSNAIALEAGDLLLSTDADEDIDGVTYNQESVFVFRPDTFGDYSQGSFFLLIDGKAPDTNFGILSAIALVEKDTSVGGVTLSAGEFLLAHEGAGSDLFRFTPGTLGATTTGTVTPFLDNNDIDLGQKIGGLHLVHSDTTLAGKSLTAGQLLLSLQGDDATVGDAPTIDVLRQDVVVLDISNAATGAATAHRLFEGLDESLDGNNETLWGVSLQSNAAPELAAQSFSIDENSVAATVVGTVTATDPEGNSPTYAILAGNTDGAFAVDAATGQITVANAAALDFETTPTFNLTVAAVDSAGAYATAGVTVNINNLNEAPAATDDAFSVSEDSAFDTSAQSAWQYRTRLTFDNAAQAENLDGFPVLIQLDGSRIDYLQTQDSGEDLRFYDSDGTTLLAHEIELWNEAGTSYVWVKVPRIDAASSNDSIYMDYGNPSASDGQNAAAVWSDGYRAVYHLTGDPGPAGTVTDSTGLHDGTNAGTTDASGAISGGQNLDGISQYVNLGQDRDFINNATAATVSAWVNPDTTTATGDILGVSINGAVDTGGSRAAIIRNGDNIQVIARTMDDSSDTVNAVTATSPLSAATWHFVSATIDYASDVDNIKIYVDGSLEGTFSHNFTNNAIPNTNSTNSAIGTDEDGGAPYFDGQIDEARIAAVERSADWISAQYLSMTDNFVTFGSKQVLDGVLANDIDVDGDTLVVSEVNGITADVGNPSVLASGAVLTLNSDGSFTYDPNGQFESLGVGDTAVDAFAYTAVDGGGQTDTATVTITINGANDDPAGAGTLTTTSLNDNAGATALFGGLSVSDVDTGENDLVLTITLTDPLAGSLAGGGFIETAPGSGIYTVSGLTVAQANAALDNATFTPTDNTASAGTFNTDISVTVNDQGGNGEQSVLAPTTVTITRVNDDPTGAGSLTTTTLNDNAGATALFSGLTIGDVDAGENDLILTISLTNPAAGTLTGGGFTETSPGTGIYTVTGLTVAQANTALDDVQFTPADNTGPSGTFNTDISVTVNDQGGGGEQDVLAATTVTITRVNDAPTFIGGSVGYWHFDEGTGDTTAEAAHGVSIGTLGSTASADANDPSWTAGRFGQALHFDGVDDYVEVVDAPGIDVSGPEFAASLWMKPDSGPNTEDMLFMKGDRSGNINYYLSWKDSGDMTWAFKDGAGWHYQDMAVTLPIVGEWNHVAISFDRPTVTLHVNGTRYVFDDVATGGSMDRDLTANDEPLWIGAGRDGGAIVGVNQWSGPFTGSIDDLALYNRALTDADVDAIRNGGPPAATATSFTIDENLVNSTVVGSVVATDVDGGDTLSYDITAGNTGGAFAIDANGQITIINSSAVDFETNPVFNLTVEATDGGAPGLIGTTPVTITLNDVNDNPTGAGTLTTTSLTDNAGVTSLFGGLTVTDADTGENDLSLTITLTNTGAGTLSGGGFTETSPGSGVYTVGGLTVAQAATALGNVQFTPTDNTGPSGTFNTDISVTVNDQEGGGEQNVLGATTVTITRINDGPTGAGTLSTTSLNDNAGATNLFAGLTVSDVDAGENDLSLTITLTNASAGTLSGGGFTETAPDSGIYTVTGLTVAQANTALDNVTFTPTDNTASAGTFNTDISVTVNDQGGSGEQSVLAPTTVTITRVNDDPTGSGSLTTTSIADNAGATNLFGGLTVSDIDAGENDLVLTITLTDPAAGTLGGGGFTETAPGSGTYTATAMTVAQANTALDSVAFTPTPGSGPTAVDLSVTVDDLGGGGEQGVLAATTLSITVANNNPTGAGSLTTTSLNDNAGATSLFAGLTVNDVDAGENDLALTISLTNPAAGTLSGGGFTETAPGSGVYTASGLTVAQANTALDSVTFTPTDNTASAGTFNTDIAVTVNDQGGAGEQSVLAPTTVTITRINDAPVADAVPVLSVAEDAAPSVIDLHPAFSDADDPDSALTYAVRSVSDPALVSAASITTTDGRLLLTYSANASGSTTVTVRATDPNGAFVDSSFSITVNAVNDAPQLAGSHEFTATPGTTAELTAAILAATDVDHTAAELTYELLSAPTAGTLVRDATPLATGDTFTQADLDAGHIQYRADGTNAEDRFQVQLSDAGGASAGAVELTVDVGQLRTVSVPVNEEDSEVDASNDGEPQDTQSQTRGGNGRTEPVEQDTAQPAASLIQAPPATRVSQVITPLPLLAEVDPGPGVEPVREFTSERRSNDTPRRVTASPPPTQSVAQQPAAPQPVPVAIASGLLGVEPPRSMDSTTLANMQAGIARALKGMDSGDEVRQDQAALTLQAMGGMSLGLSAGYLVWLLRSGSLIAAFLSTMPLWRGMDPLLILGSTRDEDEERRREQSDTESVQKIFDPVADNPVEAP